MTQQLDVFQSMWAMELRRPDGFEWSNEEKIAKIAEAGYRGVCFDIGYQDQAFIESCLPLVEKHNLDLIFNAFPASAADYQEAVEFAKDLKDRLRFISIIGKVTPWDVNECASITRQWLDIGEKADIPTYVEIHRNCMTNDLLFTLQLMDTVPELQMVADLSHALVNQEWYLPMPQEGRELISRFLKRSESFQGRVATREQAQVPIGYPQHYQWFELFKSWWEEGFRYWRQRHAQEQDARCVFLCELGPPVYAITGPDGYELSDRWEEALIIKSEVEKIWQRLPSPEQTEQ